MEFSKLLAFLSDWKRVLAGIVGFLIGANFFFKSPSFFWFLSLSLACSLLAFCLVFILQRACGNRSLRSTSVLLASAFLICGLMGGIIFYTQFQSLPVYQSSVVYDPIEGQCKEIQVGGGKVPAWYYSNCQGESLEEFCIERSFEDVPVSDGEVKGYYPAFEKCREAGYTGK